MSQPAYYQPQRSRSRTNVALVTAAVTVSVMLLLGFLGRGPSDPGLVVCEDFADVQDGLAATSPEVLADFYTSSLGTDHPDVVIAAGELGSAAESGDEDRLVTAGRSMQIACRQAQQDADR